MKNQTIYDSKGNVRLMIKEHENEFQITVVGADGNIGQIVQTDRSVEHWPKDDDADWWKNGRFKNN